MTSTAKDYTMYELTFAGFAYVARRVRYRRMHKTLESVKAEAEKVLARLPNRGAHPAVIYKDDERQPVASLS